MRIIISQVLVLRVLFVGSFKIFIYTYSVLVRGHAQCYLNLISRLFAIQIYPFEPVLDIDAAHLQPFLFFKSMWRCTVAISVCTLCPTYVRFFSSVLGRNEMGANFSLILHCYIQCCHALPGD